MKCDVTVCRTIQTYHPNDEKFYIGGSGLPLRNNDIRLMFGIQCRKETLDLTQGVKGPSDFMQRRCPNVGRMLSKVIKDLLMEAIRGRTERDEEDVAKLPCLYICMKLFFATTREHIGWASVHVIDKLETLRSYDWTATIRNTLINSLNETHGRPERVTSCVVSLLFLICKHSYIVKPERSNVVLQFCKWNISTLIGMLKGVNLSANFSIKNEGIVIMFDVDPVNVWDGHGADVGMMDIVDVEPSFDWWQPNSPNSGNVEMNEVCELENQYGMTPDSKKNMGRKRLADREAWSVLFPDLLDLSCTSDANMV
ncbi:hypothetical protein ACSBR2_000287 [Camellia fascicularis]